jgi:hypothetical protein
METLKVWNREFRDKLASYLLESDMPVAITRHVPARMAFTSERTYQTSDEVVVITRWLSLADIARLHL